MGQREKRYLNWLNNPKTVSFDELSSFRTGLGYTRTQSGGGGSHYKFVHADAIAEPLVIPRPHGKFIKQRYVQIALKQVESLAILDI